MPGADKLTARLLAQDPFARLEDLHIGIPWGAGKSTLQEPLDHGGFVSRVALIGYIETLTSLDRECFIPRSLLNGLTGIATNAPMYARADLPVHADSHWGN